MVLRMKNFNIWGFTEKPASAYKKQGRVKTPHLVTKFTDYRRVKMCTPPTK